MTDEPMTRVRYSDRADRIGLWLERLEPGGETYSWHHVLPERLVAAHETASAALQAAEDAIEAYIKGHDLKAVGPPW